MRPQTDAFELLEAAVTPTVTGTPVGGTIGIGIQGHAEVNGNGNIGDGKWSRVN